MQKNQRLLIQFILFLMVLFPLHKGVSQCMVPGMTYTVTSTFGTGPGSLPYVINQINTAGVSANIAFNVPLFPTLPCPPPAICPPMPPIISLSTPLPVIVPKVAIQGKNITGIVNVTISGSNVVPAPCFRFADPLSCYTNLTLVSFIAVNYVVINTNDSGPGSLRQGLSDVSASGLAGTVSFNIPGMPPHTITPLTNFPVINSPITLDATTQPANGYTGTCPKIILDGSTVPTTIAVSIEAASNSKVYGFTIKNFATGIQIKYNSSSFPVKYGGSNFIIGNATTGRNILINNTSAGITILGTKNGIIENNYIGVDCDGSTIAGNNDGIVLSGDTLATIKNNVISGNNDDGITSINSINEKIIGNKIGTDATGNTAKGNLGSGILSIGAIFTIGGSSPGEGNVISGNGVSASFRAGIMIGAGGWCRIVGNKIGTNTLGTAAIPNSTGIIGSGTPKAFYIGGVNTGERNIISGNMFGALHVRSAVDTIYIRGNYIGVGADGNTAITNNSTPSSNPTFYLRDEAKVVLVGGTTPSAANVISGNTSATGLHVENVFNLVNVKFEILGNIIGLNAAGNTAVPNRFGAAIGKTYRPVTFKNNVCSGNIMTGLSIGGDNHIIKGNKIGTDANGTLNLGNGAIGISVYGINNVVGGTTAGDANVICNNASYGIGMDYSPPYNNHYNYYSRNIFYNNGNIGIKHKMITTLPGNNGYQKPVVKFVSSTIIRGTAAPNAVIDLYQNHTYNTFEQGQSYVATTTTDALGEWVYTNVSITNPYNIIALAYDPSNFNTSEFSDKYLYTSWTAGAGTTDWFTSDNWSNGIPDCIKNAWIKTGVPQYPLLNTAVEASVYNIEISSGANISVASSSILNVCGSWANTGGSNLGAGYVVFQGSEKQYISGNNSFGSLKANNTSPQGIILLNTIGVSNYLSLNQGVISTDVNKLSLSNSTSNALVAFSNTSFINGNLSRKINYNTDTYIFPVGKGTTSADYFRIDLLNNYLSGPSSITAYVKTIIEAGNDIDSKLLVSELTNPYSNIREAAVWDLTPNFSVSSGSYGVRLYTENFLGLADNTFAPLKRTSWSTNYNDWYNQAGTSIPADNMPGRTVADGYAERTGYTSFSQHAIAEALEPLPLNFLSIEAFQKSDQTVLLTWKTSKEVNVHYFIIERSIDGSTFSNLDTIPATNNTLLNAYYYTDQAVSGLYNYYRIKEVDQNGKYSYSSIVKTSTAHGSDELKVYPNPANYFLKVSLPERTGNKIRVKIYSSTGAESILSHVEYLYGKLFLQLPSSLSSGFYTLLIEDGTSILTSRFVKE